jgi:hypothetical protein
LKKGNPLSSGNDRDNSDLFKAELKEKTAKLTHLKEGAGQKILKI